MPRNVRQLLEQMCVQVESVKNTVCGLERDLESLRIQLGMPPYFCDEDSEDEEEDLDPPGKPCWIIKERCPDGVTGTAHYFYDDDEQAWTGMKREAYRFGSEKAAVKTAKQLHRNGSYHFNEHLKSPGGKEGHNFDIVKIYAKD